MSSSYNSPSRSPGSLRLQQFGGPGSVSRLRSSSLKKPPEPLRRAVADCLSSSGFGSHHGAPSSSVVVSEASRTLRDYLAAPTTMDLAYSMILEHTISERERSPAVVARCVALLKRYLLRYKPTEETLLQIDRFCVNTIAECSVTQNQRLSPKSGSSVASTTIPTLPVSSFASGPLVKSLKYVRSLVCQHIPKRSFQPAAFTGVPSASRLPSLSSFLSRSFNSQLSPASSGESSEKKDATILPVSNLSNVEEAGVIRHSEYIALDVLKWRWLGESQSSPLPSLGDQSVNPHDIGIHNLLEIGAASLLIGEAKTKGKPWTSFGTADMPYLDQLLRPSPVTTVTNSASDRPHLRAITASKRTKLDSHQIWKDSPVTTFRPRARQLFQYRHYSEQQPLRLNPAEVCEVIAVVCSEASSPNAILSTLSARLTTNDGKPSMDVAVSVLIKLVIDMYVLDSWTAAPLTLVMLEEMLRSQKPACRGRAFDLILNLGVHAHLLEPILIEDVPPIEEEYPMEYNLDTDAQLTSRLRNKSDVCKNQDAASAIANFESWILNILYETLLLLVQIEETEECVWASALSCLLYFVCDRGKIRRSRLRGLDIRVIKAFLEASRKNSWADIVHSRLIGLLTNMFYQVNDDPTEVALNSSIFLMEQVDLVGGTEFIFVEYSLANSREERRNLFLVLFDYVLHQINQVCIATGVTEYNDDEIRPLASLFALADAPEAFYISVKLGVEGIGEILSSSISDTLCRYPNGERLNMLLDNLMEKLNSIISAFTHLDKEFSDMVHITKSFKILDNINGGFLRNGVSSKSKISWATLHSLIHSERMAYRQNGYAWLGDLLIAEISEEKDVSVWSNIEKLQLRIAQAGVLDSSVTSDIPLPISLMCGLLKSKHNFIRWGFLFVLERLLMRCKFLLDENEMRNTVNSDNIPKDICLEKANAVIDIMSSALYLVFQINETDRVNILKMCDILFSQLSLRVSSAARMPRGDAMHPDLTLGYIGESKRINIAEYSPPIEKYNSEELQEAADNRYCTNRNISADHETVSMAALLLRGQAIVPMQLVSRVPAALFYWPLIQLAGAATDNVALGVAVGSKGRGNHPGAMSDIRASLLLLLIAKCTSDPAAFQEVDGEQFFRELLDDTDSRVAYYSSTFLLKRMMTEKPEKYQHILQNLVVKAQQSNNEKLLENPYLQMRGILKLANDLGTNL